MRRVGVLPTLITLANGYCGILAIYKAADALHAPEDQRAGLLSASASLILLAMIFDVLDGKVARITGVTSRFGAYLDSLCDAISFGAAPAFLAKSLFEARFPGALSPKLLTFLSLLFAVGALLRLARYNLEHAAGEGADREGRDVAYFDGLPTPGAAGVVASLVFLSQDPDGLLDYSFLERSLPFLCPILGFLMVSRVSYIHFGNRFLKGRRNLSYLFGFAVLIALTSKFPHEALAVLFGAYLLSGVLPRRWRRGAGEPRAEEAEVAS
jgi:CDP-diacylglycerol--serine O-phosphatidyltransferase